MANAEDVPPPVFRGLPLKAPEPFTFVPEEWQAYRKQVKRWFRISEAKQLFEQDESEGKLHAKSLCRGDRDRNQNPENDSEGKPNSKSLCRGDRDRKQDPENDSEGKPHSKSLCRGDRDRNQYPGDDSEQDKSEGKPHSKSQCPTRKQDSGHAKAMRCWPSSMDPATCPREIKPGKQRSDSADPKIQATLPKYCKGVVHQHQVDPHRHPVAPGSSTSRYRSGRVTRPPAKFQKLVLSVKGEHSIIKSSQE
jgi:hypothetical protein